MHVEEGLQVGQAAIVEIAGVEGEQAREDQDASASQVFEGSYSIREVPGDLAVVQTLRGTREVRAECGDEEVDARWEIRASRR